MSWVKEECWHFFEDYSEWEEFNECEYMGLPITFVHYIEKPAWINTDIDSQYLDIVNVGLLLVFSWSFLLSFCGNFYF